MLAKSQGQLLKMHLLESRLLNTFFKNVICSTEKRHLLDRKKYAVRVPSLNFEQLMKKCRAFACTAYFFDFRADANIFVICSNSVEQSRFWCRAVFSSR
jgi:hypothetical protein